MEDNGLYVRFSVSSMYADYYDEFNTYEAAVSQYKTLEAEFGSEDDFDLIISLEVSAIVKDHDG